MQEKPARKKCRSRPASPETIAMSQGTFPLPSGSGILNSQSVGVLEQNDRKRIGESLDQSSSPLDCLTGGFWRNFEEGRIYF